jgi:cell division protein FtsI (penicillin-binding protein 3)
MKNLPHKRRRWMKVRIVMLTGLLLVFAGLVTSRAYDLQVARAPLLREMAEEQYLRDVRLSPKRGTIYDRHGAELAVSVDVDSAWANPRELAREGRDPVEVANLLGTVLDIDEAQIATRLASDRYFVWIKRRLTPREANRVRELGIPGVHMEREARRYYPNRELASHVLGFANVDGRGIEGLELALDEELRGSVEAVPAIRDREGRVVFSEQLLDDRSAQGEDVYLTIDKTIQHIAERELALAVRTFEARAGSVVVLDPTTGEILALANYPTFNPNEPARYDAAHRRNRAITDFFEPGSTMKPFTIAGALAAETIRTDQLIDCQNGIMEIGEEIIHDSHAYSELTPAQILAHSSNIGTAKIGASMGRRGLFRTLRRFGFGERTSLPMPGETEGILRHYRHWYEMDAATISFGQGMSVTNVQLAAAMGAIANGGRLMDPILVRRVASADETVTEAVPRVRRHVVPEHVADLVGDMLTAVTGPDGTGAAAAIDGYLVAGKTGTAQKADYVHGGYAENSWLASFVGFVPAENPRLVISVIIDEPVIAYYGGEVAGPVFRRVGESALRHLGVPASAGGEALVELSRERRQREAALARAERERARAERLAARERRRARLEGREVPETEPALEAEPELAPLEENQARVPELEGSTIRHALVALRDAGLEAEVHGSGLVRSLEPDAGSIVDRGSRVLVLLAPRGEPDEPLETPVAAVVAEGPVEPALETMQRNRKTAAKLRGSGVGRASDIGARP